MFKWISGSAMSLATSGLLFKIYLDPKSIDNLNNIEILYGWFLLIHVHETYNLTSGKYFMTNQDFRKLITNIIKALCLIFLDLKFYIRFKYLIQGCFCFLIVWGFLVIFNFMINSTSKKIKNNVLFYKNRLISLILIYLLIIYLIFYLNYINIYMETFNSNNFVDEYSVKHIAIYCIIFFNFIK